MIRLIIYMLLPENLVIIHDQSLSSPSPSQSTYMRNTLTSQPAAASFRTIRSCRRRTSTPSRGDRPLVLAAHTFSLVHRAPRISVIAIQTCGDQSSSHIAYPSQFKCAIRIVPFSQCPSLLNHHAYPYVYAALLSRRG